MEIETTVLPAKHCPLLRRLGISARIIWRPEMRDCIFSAITTGMTVACFAAPLLLPHIREAMHVPWDLGCQSAFCWRTPGAYIQYSSMLVFP